MESYLKFGRVLASNRMQQYDVPYHSLPAKSFGDNSKTVAVLVVIVVVVVSLVVVLLRFKMAEKNLPCFNGLNK